LQSVATKTSKLYFWVTGLFQPTDKLNMTQKLLKAAEGHELIDIVNELRSKLKKKHQDLTKTRERLNKAKSRIQKLKGIVTYQRERIIQLHS
jgi:uncharacterized protein (UPF0305 family)